MKELTYKNNGTFSDNIWKGILHHIESIQINEMDILDVKPGYAKVSLTADDTNRNLYQCTHGGAIFTLCDLTSGMAVYAYGVSTVTLSGNINYLRPGMTNLIYAEAVCERKGKTTAV